MGFEGRAWTYTGDVMATTFLQQCLAGDVDPGEIDDFVDAWHEGAGTNLSLHEFLGLDECEHALWLENPDMLSPILAARRFGAPLQTAVIDADDGVGSTGDQFRRHG
jgi:hypothetical protein